MIIIIKSQLVANGGGQLSVVFPLVGVVVVFVLIFAIVVLLSKLLIQQSQTFLFETILCQCLRGGSLNNWTETVTLLFLMLLLLRRMLVQLLASLSCASSRCAGCWLFLSFYFGL